ncbi:YjgN family protein [Celeribacter sp.]|uniref:YjgN family protein n=1 Tax=Celeribacter sp. TaxID=1890673 RepID=UPI003A93F959
MAETTTHRVEFSGSGREYFSIWIVNLLLSIVTLGIYSAWAKVRRRKYFAQHTQIDSRRFDYHATGKQIFIGRVIVIVGFLIYSLLSAIPLIGILFALGFLVLVPWLINRSMAFNARMTSFSGLRFSFKGTKMRAFLVYMLYPFLSAFTLYLTFPLVARAQQRYRISNHKFGTAQFHFDSTIGPFYKAFLMAIGWAVAVLVVTVVLFGGYAFLGAVQGAGEIARVFAVYLLIFIAVLPAAFIYRAFVRNAVYAGASLEGGHSFTSDVRPLALLGVAMTNAVGVVLTLGFFIPWAQCRMTRYLADHTSVTVDGSIDQFIAGESEAVGAIGDAFTDLEGVDLDFAL